MCHWVRINAGPVVPLGNGNMMLILDYVPHFTAQMMSFEEIDDALKFLTVNGATTLGLRDVRLGNGQASKLIVLDADSVFNAVYEGAARYCVRCAPAARCLPARRPSTPDSPCCNNPTQTVAPLTGELSPEATEG